MKTAKNYFMFKIFIGVFLTFFAFFAFGQQNTLLAKESQIYPYNSNTGQAAKYGPASNRCTWRWCNGWGQCVSQDYDCNDNDPWRDDNEFISESDGATTYKQTGGTFNEGGYACCGSQWNMLDDTTRNYDAIWSNPSDHNGFETRVVSQKIKIPSSIGKLTRARFYQVDTKNGNGTFQLKIIRDSDNVTLYTSANQNSTYFDNINTEVSSGGYYWIRLESITDPAMFLPITSPCPAYGGCSWIINWGDEPSERTTDSKTPHTSLDAYPDGYATSDSREYYRLSGQNHADLARTAIWGDTVPAPVCSGAHPSVTAIRADATSGTFRVYADGVSNATSVSFPTWSSVNGQDDLFWYPGTNAGGGTWYADIDLSRHRDMGSIYVHVYMNNSSHTNTFCHTADFSRISPPTCTEAHPQAATTTSNTGTLTAYMTGVSNVTSVYFPTWSNVNGQDDLIWYPGINAGSGNWYANIDLSKHPGLGNIAVHTYMNNAAYTNTWCDSADFTRVLPNCDTGTISCGTCSGGAANTCSNNGTRTCTHNTYSGGGSCTPITFTQPCSIDNCTVPNYTCSSGTCICTSIAAPTNLAPSGTITPGTRNITWGAVSGANGYYLRVDDQQSGSGTCTAGAGSNDVCTGVLPANTTSYSYNFQQGHSYDIWVHAVRSCGSISSATSTHTVVSTNPVTLNNPSLNACTASSYSGSLSWNANTTIGGYWVDISTSSSFTTYYHKWVTTNSTAFPAGFNGYQGVTGALSTIGGITYYARVYNGATSNTVSFSKDCPPYGTHDGANVSTSDNGVTTCNTWGWACDSSNFNQAVSVHIYKDGPAGGGGTMIGAASANENWGNYVQSQCGNNPNHGFTFQIPNSSKDGLYHNLYAYAINLPNSGANPMLSGTPKSFMCCPTNMTAPTGLSPSGSALPGRRDIVWNPVNGATGYYLRVDDQQSGGEVCTGSAGPNDVCTGVLPTSPTSYSYNFLPNHSYSIRIHEVVNNAQCWGPAAAVTASFRPLCDIGSINCTACTSATNSCLLNGGTRTCTHDTYSGDGSKNCILVDFDDQCQYDCPSPQICSGGVCTDNYSPWLQIQGGDIHSNTQIDLPGKP